MIDAAKKSNKQQITYSFWTTDDRKKKVKKTLHLNKDLEPLASINQASYQIRFIFNLGNLTEVTMEDLKSGEIITISGNVLKHFLTLPRQNEEQFSNRKKEILSGKSGLKNKKIFMLNCIRYLE